MGEVKACIKQNSCQRSKTYTFVDGRYYWKFSTLVDPVGTDSRHEGSCESHDLTFRRRMAVHQEELTRNGPPNICLVVDCTRQRWAEKLAE